MIVLINKMQLFRVFIVVATAWFLLLAACSIERLTGGSAGETGNPVIMGMLFDNDGNPISNAAVLALPETYDPMLGKNSTVIAGDTTDEYGKYRITLRARGFYNIQAVQISSRTRVLITHLAAQNDSTIAPSGTLSKPGVVKVFLPEGFNRSSGYVYLPGTVISAQPGEADDFVILDSVPAGTIPSINYGVLGGTTVSAIRYRVSVVSADTSTVTRPAWKYSARIILNTSASGAGIAGTVTDFPVLIRLRAAIIDFSQAKRDGSDVRFTKADELSLPYEIERWDAINQEAEIWVKTDTIYGNNSTQTITMYWGNTVAADSSNGSAVFDTGRGFAGVWHLGGLSGALVPDATANGSTGTAKATSTVSGAIGMAQSFDGVSSVISASGPGIAKLNFPENGSYSISAWANAAVVNNLYHGIVYKSNFQYGLQIRPENVWEFFTFIEGTGWEGSRFTATANSWHFISGVRRGNQQYLYVDGACVDSTKVVVTSPLSRVEDSTLEIGHCPDGGKEPDRYFSGIIDEVRISRVANSADWIKLCYMNQKEMDALVQW